MCALPLVLSDEELTVLPSFRHFYAGAVVNEMYIHSLSFTS